MGKVDLLIVVTTISLFISLFLAFFLLTVKTKHKTSNLLFAAFLVVTAIDISDPLVGLIVKHSTNLGMLKNTIAFLQIPIFYLYIRSACYSDFQFKAKYFIHLLPFVISNIILVPRFYSVNLLSKLEFILNRNNRIELQFNHVLFHIQIVVYFIAILLLLKKAKKLYLENFASANSISYNWLFQFTVVLTILYVIVILKNIFKFSDYPYISESIRVGILVMQLFIICWYLYKALNNPSLFRNFDSKLKLVSDIVVEEKKLEAEILSEDLLKLKKYMINEKPFINPSITILDVANGIEIPVRELSILINHQLGKHFYDFVNSYRVESAMEILNDSSKSKVTILEILYEVGFNSKSSFNTAFKKHTGNTPTFYRNKL